MRHGSAICALGLCSTSMAFRALCYGLHRKKDCICELRAWSRFGARSRHFALTSEDEEYLNQAIEHAKNGLGHTFPNPAVGCVLVRQDTGQVIGSGFHPRAGFPHAEIFALFEAAGRVQNGVDAAKAVVTRNKTHLGSVQSLTETYSTPGGPESLFADSLSTYPVTAYVTLEPCCHYGKTPPCAASLALAKATRVVVGFRDPNPRVDGGGVKLLQEAGVTVDMAEGRLQKQCAALVTDFCKRIIPRAENQSYEYVTGAMRRALRGLVARMKQDSVLVEISWGGDSVNVDDGMDDAVDALELEPEWMEHLDGVLWKKELVLLRLNKAVAKKRAAKRLGERIAGALQAHVAQSVGHTVLLYRPGIPPVLDLQLLVAKSSTDENRF